MTGVDSQFEAPGIPLFRRLNWDEVLSFSPSERCLRLFCRPGGADDGVGDSGMRFNRRLSFGFRDLDPSWLLVRGNVGQLGELLNDACVVLRTRLCLSALLALRS